MEKNKVLPILEKRKVTHRYLGGGGIEAVAIAQRDEDWKRVKPILHYATSVMALLKQHGPSIVPHLLDTDDNDGEFLRQALAGLEEKKP